MAEKFDIYATVSERIIEALENHNIPWRKPWKSAGISWPYNGATKYRYNGINVMLLWGQQYGDPRWYTFKQVRKIKGATVRRGEQSTMIVYWNFVKKTGKDEDGEDAADTVPILRYYRVFNAQQIDGIEELPREDESIEFDPITAAEAVVAEYSDKPDINYIRQNRAFYRPLADTITMPTREQFEGKAGEFYSTLFHEMAHSTGHPSRLDRKSFMDASPFGSETYSKEELVAEFTSAFLCAEVGIDNTLDNSTAYIKGWLKALKDDKKLAIFAAAQANKAANYIRGRKAQYEETEEAA